MYSRRYGSLDYAAATGVMRQVLVRAVNETYEALLPSLRCPVELVWGEGDDQVPVSVAREALALIPQGRLTVVPGDGHHVLRSSPGAVREAIRRVESRTRAR